MDGGCSVGQNYYQAEPLSFGVWTTRTWTGSSSGDDAGSIGLDNVNYRFVFPPDDIQAPVDAMTGSWPCPYCGSRQHRDRLSCSQCGAPREAKHEHRN